MEYNYLQKHIKTKAAKSGVKACDSTECIVKNFWKDPLRKVKY